MGAMWCQRAGDARYADARDQVYAGCASSAARAIHVFPESFQGHRPLGYHAPHAAPWPDEEEVMRYTKIAIFVVTSALCVAFATASADARRWSVKRAGAAGWTPSVISIGPGRLYGPHYGYPSHPSYWYGPTYGVYAVNPSVCYAPRAYPSFGQWWQWQLEYVC
jgi:hypothetical protein